MFLGMCLQKEKNKKNYVGRRKSPYNEGKGDTVAHWLRKGDTLAQKSRESPPPQSYKTDLANGDLEG
eukprot:738992-Pelagomonas_calceolata.AAC.1